MVQGWERNVRMRLVPEIGYRIAEPLRSQQRREDCPKFHSRSIEWNKFRSEQSRSVLRSIEAQEHTDISYRLPIPPHSLSFFRLLNRPRPLPFG
jgi:hypothetical protein